MRKKSLSTFLLAVFLISCPFISSISGLQDHQTILSYGSVNYGKLERLFVEGNIIRDRIGQIILYGNDYGGRLDWTTPPYHFWDLADEHAVYMKENELANSVIFDALWNFLETSESPTDFRYDEDYIDQIVTAVDYFNSQGIYVIIHAHAIFTDGGTTNLRKFMPEAIASDYQFSDDFFTGSNAREHLKRLWLKLSSRFKDNWGVAGYYLLMETWHTGRLTRQEVMDEWFNMQNYVTAALRDAGDNHIVIATPAPGSGLLLMNRRLLDNNTVYGTFFYDGLNVSVKGGIVNNNNLDFLRDAFNTYIGNEMREFKIPILITEYGYLYWSEIGDEKDVWIQNAHTVFRENVADGLSGWMYCGFAANPAGDFTETGTWMQRLPESVDGLPTEVHFAEVY